MDKDYTGEVANGYKLLDPLGRGAFGQVYRVEELETKEM